MLVESSQVWKKESLVEFFDVFRLWIKEKLLMFASTYKGLRIESFIILLIFESTRSYTAYVNLCLRLLLI